MRDDTLLEGAAPADEQKLRVADVIATHALAVDRRNDERRRGAAAEIEHGAICLLERVEDRRPQLSRVGRQGPEHARERRDGEIRRFAAGRCAADAVGHGEHERAVGHGNDRGRILVRRGLVGRAQAAHANLAERQAMLAADDFVVAQEKMRLAAERVHRMRPGLRSFTVRALSYTTGNSAKNRYRRPNGSAGTAWRCPEASTDACPWHDTKDSSA